MTKRSLLSMVSLALLVATAWPAAESHHPQRLEVVADGHALSVWAKRPAHPRGAILLVHGMTWSALPNFDLQVEGQNRSVMDALSRRGYAVYAIDNRGYGATARDATGWLTPARAAKDISIVLAWISSREAGQRPVLIGYSRGAVMSLFAAQLFPDAMSTLVLCALVRDIDQKSPTTETAAEPARQRTTGEMAASDFITPSAAPRAVVDAYVRKALAVDPIRVDWHNEYELNDLDPAKVHVPTLVIRGALDPRATAEKDMKIFSRLGTPDRSLVVLPSADHALHVEDSQAAWVDAIVSFVERPRLIK
jgi:alpha-beta hydrolase superfamily lysophospholipase